MNRSAALAATVVGAGVLTVAAVSGLALIRSGQGAPPPESVAIAPMSPQPGASVDALPTLPAVPAVPAVPTPPAVPAATSAALSPVDTQPSSPSAAPASPAAEVAGQPTISRRAARSAVLAQTSGSVLTVASTVHQGTPAWAVTVTRKDGSIVTGYVDTVGGVVFDWTLDQAAKPTSTRTTSAQQYGDDEGEHGDNDD